MYYNHYPYTIFNQDALSNQTLVQAVMEQQYRNDQQQHILVMRKAIGDFIKAAKKVAPEYQQAAMDQCLQEILLQANTR